MTPDRWEQINHLYHAALEEVEKDRPSFLEKSCGDHAELSREVESLLDMHAQADGFLGKSAMQGSLPND